MTIYFENLIIALQVLYIFKKHVKLIQKKKKCQIVDTLFCNLHLTSHGG